VKHGTLILILSAALLFCGCSTRFSYLGRVKGHGTTRDKPVISAVQTPEVKSAGHEFDHKIPHVAEILHTDTPVEIAPVFHLPGSKSGQDSAEQKPNPVADSLRAKEHRQHKAAAGSIFGAAGVAVLSGFLGIPYVILASLLLVILHLILLYELIRGRVLNL
jgi:hypothetical protein